eukprot:m.101706 g.101706  ORF g.101706 m.101706 type:complete len:233 (+) comp14096_c0_seq5:1217-1915(+)
MQSLLDVQRHGSHGGATLNSPHLAEPLRSRTRSTVDACISELEATATRLLSLAILLPAAPMPVLATPAASSVDIPRLEELLLCLPPFARDRRDGRRVLDTLLKRCQLRDQLLRLQLDAAARERSFLGAVIAAQTDFCDAVFADAQQTMIDFALSQTINTSPAPPATEADDVQSRGATLLTHRAEYERRLEQLYLSRTVARDEQAQAALLEQHRLLIGKDVLSHEPISKEGEE